MPDNVTLPVAGWYPQDDGSLRWWDGEAWTDQRMPNTPTQPPRPRRVGSIVSAIVLGLFVGAALVGAFFFLNRETPAGPQSAASASQEIADPDGAVGAFDFAPEEVTQVDLFPFGGDISLSPFLGEDGTPMGAVNVDEQTVFAVEQDGDSSLVSVSPDSSEGYAQWTWRMPAGDSDCTVGPKRIQCDDRSYDLTEAGPVPAQFAGDDESEVAELVDEARERGMVLPESTLLATNTSEDVPYRLSGGVLEDEGGNRVAEDLVAADYWALPAGSGSWVISNGEEVLAVSGKKLLWRLELADGSAELNGFGGEEPRWQASGDVVLMAQPNGIFAFDVESGEVLWQIDTPVQSWEADAENVLVNTGTSFAVSPFRAPSDGEGADHEDETTSMTLPMFVQPSPFPFDEQILNATLDVPERLAIPGNKVTFKDGGYAADPYEHNWAESAWVNGEPIRVVLDGQPYAVVPIVSFVDQRERRFIGVYDADLSLVDGIDWPNPDVTAERIRMCLGEFAPVANGPVLTIEDRGLANPLGDGQVGPECGADTYYATVTMLWTGSAYETIDILYHTPHGLSRHPDMAQLQEIYDQVAAGNEDAVSDKILDGTLSSKLDSFMYDDPTFAGDLNFRDVLFTPGGKVVECAQVPYGGMTFTLPGGMTMKIPNARPDPGDFECLVSSGSSFYSEGLIKWQVRTDSEGNPQLVKVHNYMP